MNNKCQKAKRKNRTEEKKSLRGQWKGSRERQACHSDCSQNGERSGWKEDEKENINLVKGLSLLLHAIFTVPSAGGL